MPERWREVPPTAGLPLRWRDFVSFDAALERRLAAFLGVPEVAIECSGTAALVIALTVLKRASRRRSVIVPAYTCPLVVLAVAHCGLRLVPCDLRPNHFDMSPDALSALCDDDTLAVIPTHLGGRVADLATSLNVARRAGASVIEDAAQSLGATWNGRAAGTVGDIGFHSLAVGKGLTLYEGGVLTARDPEMRRLLREASGEIAPRRLLWDVRRFAQLAGYAALYRPSMLPLAYGIPRRRALKRGDLEAAVGDDCTGAIPLHRVGAWRRAVGAAAFTRLPHFLATVADQAAARKGALEKIAGVVLPGDAEGGLGTWPYFMVLMPTARARDAALARLWRAGLGVSRLFIHALPDYPSFAAQFRGVEVPNASDFAARMLTISNSPWLGEGDFQRICSVLAESVRA
jgi:perosamine synthetase